MNKLDFKYQELLKEVLDKGVSKEDRTGTGTISMFGKSIEHNMQEGFPILTTKKMYFKGIVSELIWFLMASSDIRELWKSNCNIWDGDWYKGYSNSVSSPYGLAEIKFKVNSGDTSFDNTMFDLGPIYGKQWRSWGIGEKNEKIDQLQQSIDLLKSDPDSRRMLVSAWNPGELNKMILPPCHYSFQFYTRELSWKERWEYYIKEKDGEECINDKKLDALGIPRRGISLLWNQRSADLFLGVPFNISSYGLLLEIVGKIVNMVPDKLIGNFGDIHLYKNHIEQANMVLDRKPYELPRLKINSIIELNKLSYENFSLINYNSHSKILAPLSN